MGKLAIFAPLQVRPGAGVAALEALLDQRARRRRDALGTIPFDVLPPDEQPVLPAWGTRGKRRA
jgi:hypothetical protein